MVDLISRAAALNAISTEGGCGMCASRILDIPTIGAIPVEWLGQQRDKRRAAAAAHSNISSMTVLEAINVVLELWQKEREVK